MASWSCPAGWATEGLAGGIGGGRGARGGGGWMGGGIGSGDSRGYVDLSNPSGVGGGVVAVCRSNAGDVLAVSSATRTLERQGSNSCRYVSDD